MERESGARSTPPPHLSHSLSLSLSFSLTRIVDQDVDGSPAKGVQGGPHARGREGRVRDVPRERRRLASAGFNVCHHAGRLSAVQVGDQDGRAVDGEQAGGGGAQALARARDDGDLMRNGWMESGWMDEGRAG